MRQVDTSFERLLDVLAKRGSAIRRRGDRQASAQCPAHEDRNPSLSITYIEGQTLVYDHGGCATEDVLAAAGLTAADLFDDRKGISYTYDDGRIVRRTPAKNFFQSGNTSGVAQLYRLAKVQEAVQAGTPIWLVEGEKDVHALESLGAIATTAPMGAKNVSKCDLTPLIGAHLIIVPDQDNAGQQWLGDVLTALSGRAKTLLTARPASGKDPADHIAAGYQLADFQDFRVPNTPDDEYEQLAHFERQVFDELDKLRVRREARRRLDAENRPQGEPPEILTLRERLARPKVPVRWRIEGWQPAGSRIVLAAQYKSGKTTLVGNLIRCLVDGRSFLNRADVAQLNGTAVLLDFEMGGDQLDEWLRDQGITHDDQVVIIPLRGAASSFDILDDQILTRWAEQIKSHRAEYVVLDCLRPVLDALGLDEHKDAGRFLVAFDELLKAAGVPDALVVHHMGHGSERSRGDSRIRDWPDVEWRLVREDDEPHSARYVSAYGRDVDQPESLLHFNSTTRHLSIAGGNRKQAAAQAALVDVVKVLEDNDPDKMSSNAIEMALYASEHSRKAIRDALQLGVRLDTIKIEPGPKNSKLHYLNKLSSPVRRSSPQFAGRAESLFAAASIERRTETEDGADASSPNGEHPTCIQCGFGTDTQGHQVKCEGA